MARHIFTLLVAVLLFAQTAAGQTQQTQTPPPTPPKASGEPAVRADAKAYEVGAGDRLSIVIYGENDLPKEFGVGVDGMINFPFIGDLKVTGLSIREIEAEVRKRLMEGKYLSNPQVVATVTEYRSQTVQVTGQVHKPGDILLEGTELTLTRALARAELTALAGSYVEIRRPKPGVDPSLAGPDAFEIERIERAALDAMTTDPRLRDGDSIYVPKAPVYYMNGYVKTVGAQVWSPGITIGKAIAAAGGLTDRGTYSRLKIRRMVDGKFKDFKADQNTLIQPDDQIHVAQRKF